MVARQVLDELGLTGKLRMVNHTSGASTTGADCAVSSAAVDTLITCYGRHTISRAAQQKQCVLRVKLLVALTHEPYDRLIRCCEIGDTCGDSAKAVGAAVSSSAAWKMLIACNNKTLRVKELKQHRA